MNSTEAKIKLSFPLARRRQRRRATSSLARRLARHVLVRPVILFIYLSTCLLHRATHTFPTKMSLIHLPITEKLKLYPLDYNYNSTK